MLKPFKNYNNYYYNLIRSTFRTHTSLKSFQPNTKSMAYIDFISKSPILESIKFTKSQIQDNLPKYNVMANLLLQSLNISHPDNLTPDQKIRIYQYYLPVAIWIKEQLNSRKGDKPLVIGISAPQGCGKSTIVNSMEFLFNRLGEKVASISIDDFYLERTEQEKLAQDNSENPLLQCRGNAGTHDLELGSKTLQALKELIDEEKSVLIPRYDKSAFSGKGDRMSTATWPVIRGPVKLILFEGWMLGFRPVDEKDIKSPHIKIINKILRQYENAWDSFVDAWLVIKVKSPKYVYNWRLQAEHAMRASGKDGMSDEEVIDFVNRYMPAYETYLPGLYENGPTTAKEDNCLIIEVDENRNPIQNQISLGKENLNIVLNGIFFISLFIFSIIKA